MQSPLLGLPGEELRNIGSRLVAEANLSHVGFIVDGNRRWAKSHNLPPIEGHKRAIEVILERVNDQVAIGLPVTSYWLFSTENWKREHEQIDALFDLAIASSDRLGEEFRRLGVSFKHIGRKDRIPEELEEKLVLLEAETHGEGRPLVVAAIDYGGRDEIIRAFNAAIDGGETKLDEDGFSRFLDTIGIPNPDMVIRTSGESRTSGFMIWQAAYSEWLFPKTLFPDFDLAQFISALQQFAERDRRFGR